MSSPIFAICSLLVIADISVTLKMADCKHQEQLYSQMKQSLLVYWTLALANVRQSYLILSNKYLQVGQTVNILGEEGTNYKGICGHLWHSL